MSARAFAGLAATAAATALLWLALGTSATLPETRPGAPGWSGDFLHFYLPNAEYAGARMARGELPLWNPQQGAGGPFLATLQVGVLYPPNWLHALLPATTAFVALAALHVALAVLLAGGLATALGAGGLGAAVAGLVYATSFNTAGSVWTPPVHYASAWAPGILWAVDRVAARPDARRITGFAVSLALALLAGWPYVVAMTALAAALYAAALLVGLAVRTRHVPLRPALALAAGAAAGLALAAPQLLPSLELVARSVRAVGSLVEGQAVWVPEVHSPAKWFRFFEEHGFNDAIPGLAALALCALAAGLPRPGRMRLAALLGIGALALLVSFPEHTPLFGWLRALPPFGDFRFPFRYRLLLNVAVSVGAGVGAGQLPGLLGARPRAARALGAAALAACVLTTTLPCLRAIRPFARGVPERSDLVGELAALGIDRARGRWGRLYWFGRSEKIGLAPDLYTVHDLEPITLARTAQMITFFESGRPLTLATVDKPPTDGERPEMLSAPFYGHLALPESGERSAILDLFSVRWLVSERPLGWLERRYRRVTAADAELAAYQNPWALPHAYRVTRVAPEPDDPLEALRQLAAPRFPRRSVALVDAPPPGLELARGERPPKPAGKVDVSVYEPERVVLHTRGPEPAVVVLSDAWFPGWHATLDAEPARLLRANVDFRGVAVPAGEHVIEMRYRPASLRRGLALALMAAAACGAGLVPLRGPRRLE